MAMPTALAKPWPERAGGGLDAGRVARARDARACVLPHWRNGREVVERQVVAGQVQQRVEQHAAVARGEHEAVAVGPGRVGGVEAQVPREEDVRHRRRAHRHAGMTGLGLLHGVDGEEADGVDAALLERSSTAGSCRLVRGASARSVMHTFLLGRGGLRGRRGARRSQCRSAAPLCQGRCGRRSAAGRRRRARSAQYVALCSGTMQTNEKRLVAGAAELVDEAGRARRRTSRPRARSPRRPGAALPLPGGDEVDVRPVVRVARRVAARRDVEEPHDPAVPALGRRDEHALDHVAHAVAGHRQRRRRSSLLPTTLGPLSVSRSIVRHTFLTPRDELARPRPGRRRTPCACCRSRTACSRCRRSRRPGRA